MMLKWLSIVILLSPLMATPAFADYCDKQATEFSKRGFTKVSPRMAGNVFLLTDERFPRFGARFLCNGPRGTAVTSESPPRLDENWVDIVAEFGSVLTRAFSSDIASGIHRCMSNPLPEFDELVHRIDYQTHDFTVSCELSKSDGLIEFSITKVVR